jgi:ABC-type polysaccharide/polyol phosphate export permease
LFRIIVYDGSLPTLGDWLIPSGIAIGTLLLGFFVLMKQDLDLVFRL